MVIQQFELIFKDGQKRNAEAPTFSAAIAIAAYKRYSEEGCILHRELTVHEKQCMKIGERERDSHAS